MFRNLPLVVLVFVVALAFGRDANAHTLQDALDQLNDNMTPARNEAQEYYDDAMDAAQTAYLNGQEAWNAWYTYHGEQKNSLYDALLVAEMIWYDGYTLGASGDYYWSMGESRKGEGLQNLVDGHLAAPEDQPPFWNSAFDNFTNAMFDYEDAAECYDDASPKFDEAGEMFFWIWWTIVGA
jgi:hypothetical protein